MFWTTIPHVALVACLPLAGNNPSLWQAVAADHDHNHDVSSPPDSSTDLTADKPTSTTTRSSIFGCIPLKLPIIDLFRKVYVSGAKKNTQYKAAWVWNRGPNKARWIARLAGEYEASLGADIRKEVLGGRWGSHVWISGVLAFVLIFVPVFFGALVRYVCLSVCLFFISPVVCLSVYPLMMGGENEVHLDWTGPDW